MIEEQFIYNNSLSFIYCIKIDFLIFVDIMMNNKKDVRRILQ